VGLSNAESNVGFFGAFAMATTSLDADAPVPTVLPQFFVPVDILPFTIPLSLGAGDLVINDLVSLGETASITAVPEPTTLTLLGLSTLGFAAYRRRRAQG